MNEALKPYVARSVGLHLLGAAAYLFLVPKSGMHADKVYMIDFVGGPTATITSASPAAAAASAKSAPPPAEIAAQVDPDAVAVAGRRHGPIALPRPSLLHGAGKEPETPVADSPSASLAGPGGKSTTSPSHASVAGAGGGRATESAAAGVTTDLPNFPYPWYISQVRLMLWQAWQKRMPRLDADGSVAFAIFPNGGVTDLAVESSSGDASFDRAALDSVQSAAPFPPLPSDFREPFLKIHLALKSEEAWR